MIKYTSSDGNLTMCPVWRGAAKRKCRSGVLKDPVLCQWQKMCTKHTGKNLISQNVS